MNTIKLDSYQEIITVFSSHADVVDKISKFRIALDELQSNQKKLIELHSLIKDDISAIQQTKEVSRSELVQAILPVVTIMQIFAYDKKKKNLLKRVENLSREFLQNCTDYQLINQSKKIWVIANKYGGYSLAFLSKMKKNLNANKLKSIVKLEKQYGLIPMMIKKIEDANIRFIETMLHYEDEMNDNEKKVRKCKKVYADTELLLENKIDKFVFLMESDHPEIYKDYFNARTNLKQNEIIDREKQEELSSIAALSMDQSSSKGVEVKVKPKVAVRSRPARKVSSRKPKLTGIVE